MKAASLTATEPTSKPLGLLDRLARRILLRHLTQLHHGKVVLVDGDKQYVFGQKSPDDNLVANISVRNPKFYSEIAFGGTIGSGESWMSRYWECDDLLALVRIIVRNRNHLEQLGTRLGFATRLLQRLLHRFNRNTRQHARRNIAAHYDLGNDFFSLWLDQSMMYSCAIFETPDASLAEAQRTRMDRVCQHLDLQADDHLVEIGTGWGAMAIHAAKYYGCRVTTTTISQQQYDLSRERIQQAGLSDQITLLRQDYRDLNGQYDKLVSLEMIEAIGSAQYDTYFEKCNRLLKPGGRLLIQAITIEDDRFEQYQKNVDFIQKYIFPGGCLPSVEIMSQSIHRVRDLSIQHIEEIGLHYATTLSHWRHNFFAQIDRVRALGYPDSFIRMWEYYLYYCEGGFLERSIGTVLLVADRAEHSRHDVGEISSRGARN